MSTLVPKNKDIVINWHVTEACNFKCRYCFASWEQPNAKAELWRDKTKTPNLLKGLHDFFNPTNPSNPLRVGLSWHSLRLSLAGGEPTLLGSRLTDIASHAKAIGFRISLITNGSRPDVITATAPHLDMLGLSIDSVSPATNSLIGRNRHNGSRVDIDDAIAIVKRVRAVNPRITIKLNTVVNAENSHEDLSDLITQTRPNRWKIMRMLPSVTSRLSVDDAIFQSFVARHQEFRSLTTVENNNDMGQSYIMVDPYGRFFQNKLEESGYQYSRPIVETGPDIAFSEIAFCPAKFATRYRADHTGRIAS